MGLTMTPLPVLSIDRQTIRVSVSRDEHYSIRTENGGQTLRVKRTIATGAVYMPVWSPVPITDEQIRRATP